VPVPQTHPAELHRPRRFVLTLVPGALHVRLHRLLSTPVTRRAFLRIVHATTDGVHGSSGNSRRVPLRPLLILQISSARRGEFVLLSSGDSIFCVIYFANDSRRPSSLAFRYQFFPLTLFYYAMNKERERERERNPPKTKGPSRVGFS
jgi:hypothetical protein